MAGTEFERPSVRCLACPDELDEALKGSSCSSTRGSPFSDSLTLAEELFDWSAFNEAMVFDS
jgi:hypothetical protein